MCCTGATHLTTHCWNRATGFFTADDSTIVSSVSQQVASVLVPGFNEIMLQNPLESTSPDRFGPLLRNVVDVLVANGRGIDRKLIQVSLPH